MNGYSENGLGLWPSRPRLGGPGTDRRRRLSHTGGPIFIAFQSVGTPHEGIL